MTPRFLFASGSDIRKGLLFGKAYSRRWNADVKEQMEGVMMEVSEGKYSYAGARPKSIRRLATSPNILPFRESVKNDTFWAHHETFFEREGNTLKRAFLLCETF